MSPEDLAAWAKNAFEAISNNPELAEHIPSELHQSLGDIGEKLEKADRERDVAVQKAVAAKANPIGSPPHMTRSLPTKRATGTHNIKRRV